jgi:hypothetical protein
MNVEEGKCHLGGTRRGEDKGEITKDGGNVGMECVLHPYYSIVGMGGR